MSGLILKDLFNMKSNYKFILLFVIVFGAMFLPKSGAASYLPICIVMCAILITTTMGCDELARWDKYALTMPVTRRDMVLSKYLSFVLFVLLGLALGLAICIAAGLFLHNLLFSELMAAAAAGVGLAFLFGGVLLPLLYKFGSEKGRLFMIVCIWVPILLIAGAVSLLKRFHVPLPSEGFVMAVFYCLPLISLALLFLSYLISLKIYRNKEF